jgi:long-subunit acyl-CoA synthetase (AMP-forming)
VSQAIAIGDRRKFISALLTLDPEAAKSWASEHDIDEDLEALSEHEELIAEVERGLEEANEGLARVEQVKKFKILPADWEPGGDELTPTMKLKRKPIAEKYGDEIDELYAG